MKTLYSIAPAQGRGLVLLALVALVSCVRVGFAESNVSLDWSSSWGGNIAWLNWRPDALSGVEVGQYVCSGSIYSPNVGWINLGSGLPANGIRYANNSAADFGVNVDAAGNLRGLAYGANIGWISFENTGAPRLDLRTGQLSGFAYGANVGWIGLGDATYPVAVDFISPGVDTDNDGLPDAWELSYAGDLDKLSGAGDFDHDGLTDLQEYLADTDPTDPDDHLEILSLAPSPDRSGVTLSWTSKPSRQYLVETRTDFAPGTGWLESGLGLQTPDGATTVRSLPNSSEVQFFRVRAVRPLSR